MTLKTNPEFLLQCMCYDRLQRLHTLHQQVSSYDDILAYIHAQPPKDPFRVDALRRLQAIATILSVMDAQGIYWVGRHDARYPSRLTQLHDPPLGLFIRGDISACHGHCVGVVGTRRASLMAPHRVASLVSVLSPVTVVSGGALGIDGMAHDEALQRGIPTVAVLASGLDAMTPMRHHGLFQRIVDSGIGCLVSECPPGVWPKPYFFPQRNRLIAALSSQVIVVEAAKRSGAVLTANLAAQMAVDVGAMVGAFDSPQSHGCYDLMNDGAVVLGSVMDICQFLGIHMPKKRMARAYTASVDDFLSRIPTAPIHMSDLAHQCHMTLDTVIEYVTILSLNGDVVCSTGQMVSRHVA